MLLKRFNRINWQSVRMTWLLSYVTVLMLPLVLGFLVYRESSHALAGEIHAANESMLMQIRETMDSHFQSMELLNTELTWNVKVQDLLYSNKYNQFPNEYLYDQYQIALELKRMRTAYTSIDQFYIFLKKDDTVLLPGTTRQGLFAYNVLHQDPAYPYEQWLTLADRNDRRKYISMKRISNDGHAVKAVALVSPYQAEAGYPVASNVIMIDQARILGQISTMEIFNKGHVLILNEQDEVLVSNSDITLPAGFRNLRADDGLSPAYWEVDGQTYEVSYLESEKSGMKYVSMIPSRLFWEKAEHVRRLTYLSALVSLLGGGLLTTFFLRLNYNPVKRLVHAFSRKEKLPGGKSFNEFSFLEQAVDSTFLEMDNILQQMGKQHHILRSHFIVRLLKGKLDSQLPVDEALAAYQMSFETDDFAVLLLYVEEAERFFAQIPNVPDGDKRKLLSFIVTNVVEEIASGPTRGYVADLDETLACLINFRSSGGEDRMQELLRIARESQEFLETHYKIQLMVAVSGIRSGLAGIPQAYMETLDAMEYKLVIGAKEIITYEQVSLSLQDDAEHGYYYPLQAEQQLIYSVKLGEFDKAKDLLDDIIRRNISRPSVSIPLAKCLMMNLVGTLLKAQDEIGDIRENSLFKNPKRLERLTSSETIQDMQLQLTGLLQEVCGQTASKRQANLMQARQQAIGELTGRIQSFIEAEYRNPNLNISMIGTRFDKKPAYLSKLFKDHTGEGLLDYINKTRIGKSKALIAAGRLTVQETAECVGFNDVNAFIRSFKKYEGITPGKYKETLEQSSSRGFLG